MLANSLSTQGMQNTIKSFYEKKLLEWLKPQYVFYEYAEKTTLPEKEGTSVIFNRPVSLAIGYAINEGAALSTPKILSTATVSALIQNYGDSAYVSRLLAKTSILNMYDYATKILADQAARTLNAATVMALLALSEGTVSTNNYIKDGWAISGTTGGPYFSSQTAMSMVSSAAKLALSDIRDIVTSLDTLNVPRFSDATPYKMIAHPLVINGLMADTTWATWNAPQSVENMRKGIVGNVFGVEIIKSTAVPISAGFTVSTNSAWAIGSFIFGRGAYGAVELDGGVNMNVIDRAEKLDPTNNLTVFAWDIRTTVKMLNVSSFVWAWTGAGIDRANAVSANITAPTTYVGG
jgi:N4-gp56 family major capsid protein